MQLVDAASVNRLNEAIAFPMGSILSRYCKDNPNLAPHAPLHERELKKYLWLCAQYPHRGWPMVRSLDELWHTFIIFTKEYHQFCRRIGSEYLHHQPFVDGDDVSGVSVAYQEFLALYRQNFGDPAPSVWPKEIQDSDCAKCGSGCSNGGCSGPGCGSTCGSSCR